MGTIIEGYPNYSIEPDGTVINIKTHRILKGRVNSNGYHIVELFNNGKSKQLLLHRLVAKAYIPNPNNYPVVNHKDENPANNTTENLEWCSYKYNSNYGTCIKRRVEHTDYKKMNLKERCLKHNEECKRPVIQYDKAGNYIARYESGIAAAKAFGKNHSHILECCKGKRYKTVYGYIWKYEKEG